VKTHLTLKLAIVLVAAVLGLWLGMAGDLVVGGMALLGGALALWP
jgi:hypothetical protein